VENAVKISIVRALGGLSGAAGGFCRLSHEQPRCTAFAASFLKPFLKNGSEIWSPAMVYEKVAKHKRADQRTVFAFFEEGSSRVGALAPPNAGRV
jgi:hypothetical protein